MNFEDSHMRELLIETSRASSNGADDYGIAHLINKVP